ncbi:MAG: YceI family protein [Acidimicrobiales bacterium]
MARYEIASERSRVWIDARSSVHPIHTETAGLEGWLDVDVDTSSGRLDLATRPHGRLSLPVARLRSGNPLEDREMRRRIDAGRYPTIDGELAEMTAVGDSARYLVRGDVTFRGVQRSHEAEMEMTVVGDRTISLTGEATFDVREFGMEPPRILMLRVYPEVKVRVEVVAELPG